MMAASIGWLRRLGDRPWNAGWTLLVLALGSVALWAHAHSYSPFFADDSFISLRYSERLLQGKGLTWTDGERVEGYSNLLWVLLCALPGAFGIDLVTGARVLGHLCVVSAMLALLVAVVPRRSVDGFGPLIGAFFLASTAPIAVWAWGGLEGPLGMACLVWGVALIARADAEPGQEAFLSWMASLSFGLLSWTRPDGSLFAGIAAAVILIARRRQGLRMALRLMAVTGGFVLLQLAFRLAYYDDYLPNTAYAKLVFNDQRTSEGLVYLTDSIVPLAGTWLGIGACCLYLYRKNLRLGLGLILATALAWTTYVVRIGGDIFPAWRHWLFLIGLAALAVVWITTDLQRRYALAAVLPAGVLLVVVGVLAGRGDPKNWAKAEVWEWDGVPVAQALGVGLGDKRPLIAVDAAGSIPYYSKLPALDLMGLTDRYLAHHRPRNMGHSLIGHELGDPDYYASRQPDLICFGVPPCVRNSQFPAQRAFAKRKKFRQEYTLVYLEGRGGRGRLVSELWVRREGKAGIVPRRDGMEIPGLLLANSAQAPAVLDGRQLVVRMPPNAQVQFEGAVLQAGKWSIVARSIPEPRAVRVSLQDRILGEGMGGIPLVVEVPQNAKLKISVASGAQRTHLQGLELRRL